MLDALLSQIKHLDKKQFALIYKAQMQQIGLTAEEEKFSASDRVRIGSITQETIQTQTRFHESPSTYN